MDTAYKIYASILNERLMNEIDDKLEERQFDFRRGRGVMDAVYQLSHIVNRELGKRKGKVFAYFADLKAAFDRVDRKVLRKRMREIGVSNRLKEKIMETYKETRNVVKVGGKCTEEFWTKKGVRQGCPISLTLFNIYLADLEEEMRKGQIGRVVGRRNFYMRKMKMFEALMESVGVFGAEIWGWRKEDKLDGIQRKYVK